MSPTWSETSTNIQISPTDSNVQKSSWRRCQSRLCSPHAKRPHSSTDLGETLESVFMKQPSRAQLRCEMSCGRKQGPPALAELRGSVQDGRVSLMQASTRCSEDQQCQKESVYKTAQVLFSKPTVAHYGTSCTLTDAVLRKGSSCLSFKLASMHKMLEVQLFRS